jgi:hypothetical protein
MRPVAPISWTPAVWAEPTRRGAARRGSSASACPSGGRWPGGPPLHSPPAAPAEDAVGGAVKIDPVDVLGGRRRRKRQAARQLLCERRRRERTRALKCVVACRPERRKLAPDQPTVRHHLVALGGAAPQVRCALVPVELEGRLKRTSSGARTPGRAASLATGEGLVPIAPGRTGVRRCSGGRGRAAPSGSRGLHAQAVADAHRGTRPSSGPPASRKGHRSGRRSRPIASRTGGVPRVTPGSARSSRPTTGPGRRGGSCARSMSCGWSQVAIPTSPAVSRWRGRATGGASQRRAHLQSRSFAAA